MRQMPDFVVFLTDGIGKFRLEVSQALFQRQGFLQIAIINAGF